MTEYLAPLATISIVNLLGAISPGPDFVLVVKNSLTRSRRAGIYTALGVGLGIAIHVTYTLLGFGLIISKSILLFTTIKLLGAAYLIYIGVRALFSKKQITVQTEESGKIDDLTPFEALKMGFLTNALNPKATVFFVSILSQFIDPATPVLWQIMYGLDSMLVVGGWFTIVAFILSHRAVSSRFTKVQHIVERTMGAILIALGIKVALSHAK